MVQMLPPHYTLRSKYYLIGKFWTREQIVLHRIKLLTIYAFKKLGGAFTKRMIRFTFESLRKKLIGW